MMTSSDFHGPLVRPRLEQLWTWVDPLGYRDNFRYEFEMHLLDAVETESQATIMAGGKTLKEGPTYNDYYGFGTSRDEAIKDAEKFAEDFAGASVDVIVTTKLTRNSVFFDDKKEPFYNGCVRCFRIPMTWLQRRDDVPPPSNTLVYEAWKNGEPGDDADALDLTISETKAADAAGDRRNGPLR